MRHQKASSAWYKIIMLSYVGNSLAQIMSSSYQLGHQEGHTSIILEHIWGAANNYLKIVNMKIANLAIHSDESFPVAWVHFVATVVTQIDPEN